jgi:ubiquilin
MMEDPNFMQTMNEMMNNPAFQQMLEQSPAVRNNPMARQMLRDPNFRRILFDPRMMRMQLEMDRAMGGGASAFPAPGVTDTTPQTGGATGERQQAQNTGAAAGVQHPFANLFGGPPAGAAGGQANPFAALFGMPPPQTTGTTGTASPPPAGTDANQQNQPNATMARMMEALSLLNQYATQVPTTGADGSNTSTAPSSETGSATAANNPFAALFNPWAMQPPPPPDNRPPEERYAEQLRQLNDMGFYEFERNVQALRRSGGSVQGALEWLLSDGGT